MEAFKFHAPKLANPTALAAPALDTPIASTASDSTEPLKVPSSASSLPSVAASSQALKSSQIKPPKLHHGRRLWPVLMVASLVLLLAGISAYTLLGRNRAAKPLALNLQNSSSKALPQATQAQPAPSQPAPPATPPATPAPTVVPTPAPPAAPTPAGPIRTATVKSQNGLWLRRSPDSSSQNNVVSWIPNGGQITVDQSGDIWWHGTYKGAAGYFNSRYVQ